MKEYNEFIAGREEDGMALRDFVKKKLMLSRRNTIKLKKNEGFRVNGNRAYLNLLLKEGDRIEILQAEEESENILPEQMELDIIYEDEYMIVINKPADMPVHPSRNHIMGTLANGLMHYLMGEGRSVRIRPVNRLDRNTTGLVVFAKSSHIQYMLSAKTYKEDFLKEYIALVEGVPEKDSGVIDLPIAREHPQTIRRVVRDDGERAVTHYKIIEKFGDCSLIGLQLETGRTHQIRVHMSSIGHPLLGDDLYGGSTEKISRQALHACRIHMRHPVSKELMVFEAPLPKDMAELLAGMI